MRNFDLSLASAFFSPNSSLTFSTRSLPAVRGPRTPHAQTRYGAVDIPIDVAVDITQTDQAFLLTADLPGVDPNTLEVSVHDGQLRLKGERTAATAEQTALLQRSERHTGPFERNFLLPKGIAVDKITVEALHGVVSITIPKGEATARRHIEVQGRSVPLTPASPPPTQAQASP